MGDRAIVGGRGWSSRGVLVAAGCIVDGAEGFRKGVVMARNAAGLRRRSTGAVVSRVEKLRGGGSRALLEYLADDAVAVSVSEVAAGAGLAAVAYVTERGVMPMTWRGRGVAALSVAGREASVAQVVAVLDGLDPDAVIGGAIDGAASVAAKQRKVDGYEMSFSAPKSVSALYGIGGGWVRGEIEAALAAAIGAAVEVLDDACRLTRIGSDRDRSWIETEGLLGASVLHTACAQPRPATACPCGARQPTARRVGGLAGGGRQRDLRQQGAGGFVVRPDVAPRVDRASRPGVGHTNRRRPS